VNGIPEERGLLGPIEIVLVQETYILSICHHEAATVLAQHIIKMIK
jgi:hypothetical protein